MQNSEQVLQTFGQKIVEQVRQAIQSKDLTGYGPSVASGNLINSIRYEIEGGDTLKIYAAQYIGALQFGRKPTENNTASNPTLRENIRTWIDVKGIEPNDNISKDSLAYLIARKIHNEGTIIYQRTQGGSSGLLDDVLNEQLERDIQSALMFAMLSTVKSLIKIKQAA
jgi:hypothetical protein